VPKITRCYRPLLVKKTNQQLSLVHLLQIFPASSPFHCPFSPHAAAILASPPSGFYPTAISTSLLLDGHLQRLIFLRRFLLGVFELFLGTELKSRSVWAPLPTQCLFPLGMDLKLTYVQIPQFSPLSPLVPVTLSGDFHGFSGLQS